MFYNCKLNNKKKDVKTAKQTFVYALLIYTKKQV